jgi:hypothetical protein
MSFLRPGERVAQASLSTARLSHLPHGVGKHSHHFHGGLRLRHNKQISCQVPVERPPLPELLVVPLLQHAGDIADSLEEEVGELRDKVQADTELIQLGLAV